MEAEEKDLQTPGTTKTPEILCVMSLMLNWEIQRKNATLEIEESGTNVAKLQGFLAGARAYFRTVMLAGYNWDYRIREETEVPYFKDDEPVEFSDLQAISDQFNLLEETDEWAKLKEQIEIQVESQKDFLFYRSEKGRDLYWTKGWYSGITYVTDMINQCLEAYRAQVEQKRQAPSLFDDLDDEQEAPGKFRPAPAEPTQAIEAEEPKEEVEPQYTNENGFDVF